MPRHPYASIKVPSTYLFFLSSLSSIIVHEYAWQADFLGCAAWIRFEFWSTSAKLVRHVGIEMSVDTVHETSVLNISEMISVKTLAQNRYLFMISRRFRHRPHERVNV